MLPFFIIFGSFKEEKQITKIYNKDFSLNKEYIINGVSQLSADVKLNLDCYEELLTYIENCEKKQEEWPYLMLLVDKYISYLYLLSRNHLELAILTLNTLVNPRRAVRPEEISAYNKILCLKPSELRELNTVNDLFKNLKLHEYRHRIIAHKYSERDPIEERKQYKNVKKVYESFHKW